jgi:hypothetical protein
MIGAFGAVAFLGGLIFGLTVSYDLISQTAAGVGVAIMLIGIFLPTMFRGAFFLATVGFMVAFVVGGGLAVA